MFKDDVHDPSDAKGGLDYTGNNFLHCTQQTLKLQKVSMNSSFVCSSGVPLTMQGLLEPLHPDHVFCKFECLAFCLDGELSVEQK